MPRDASGVKNIPRDTASNYSLPPGTLVNTGDTVLPSQHNPAMQDIAQALTQSLARSGVGGMLGDLNLNGNDLLNAFNGEFAGAVTVQQDVTGANLNIPKGNVVRAGDDNFALQYVGNNPRIWLDRANNIYVEWSPSLQRIRVVIFGAVVLNILPANGGVVGLGPYVQGSPT